MFQMDDELTEDELFNCCADSTEPDWGEYEGLEVAGVLEYTHHIGGEDYCEALGPDDKRAPDFYSVYARGREGFADCITDVPLDGDLVGIFRELQERSGLPLLVNWTTVDL